MVDLRNSCSETDVWIMWSRSDAMRCSLHTTGTHVSQKTEYVCGSIDRRFGVNACPCAPGFELCLKGDVPHTHERELFAIFTMNPGLRNLVHTRN